MVPYKWRMGQDGCVVSKVYFQGDFFPPVKITKNRRRKYNDNFPLESSGNLEIMWNIPYISYVTGVNVTKMYIFNNVHLIMYNGQLSTF